MKKECKRHGLTEYGRCVDRGKTRSRCKKCQVEAVNKRRRKLKKESVKYKGGKCEKCGYNKSVMALEFHHVNPEEKSFGISATGITRSWEKLKKELDKCILVCSNCHAEIHAGVA